MNFEQLEQLQEREEELINKIKSSHFKNIIILTGAGISTNAGIADYRSNEGLFAQIMKEFPHPHAHSPECLFTKSFIKKYNLYENPIYKERMNDIKKIQPTSSHYLCKFLSDRGLLRRVYTQNIDGLHQKAGLDEDMVVEYHGSLIKNNTVLYGDDIPSQAVSQTIKDFNYNNTEIDLIIVMGTSLQVAPFCALPNLVPKSCTRILIDTFPENAYVNAWTKRKVEFEGLYPIHGPLSCCKIGKRKVTLRPQWFGRSKWKSQYIITSDCDEWSEKVMN